MAKWKLETWKSSTNLEEVHYFLRRPYRYILGFNPRIVKPAARRKILKILKEEILKS